MRVLLVDDDPAYLEVLKFFLERDGEIGADTATSAKEALQFLRGTDYDAVVSDYLMPEMDGLEFLKIVRLQGNEVPFIMLTGRGREDVAIEALNSGADFYIQKGGDPKAQYSYLSTMVQRSALQRQTERSAREGERLLAGLYESVQDGISVLRSDLTIEKANPAVERWYEHTLPLEGRKCHEVYQGRSKPCDRCPALDAIETGMVGKAFLPKLGPGGEKTGLLEVHAFPVTDARTGEVTRVIEHMRDLTEEDAAKRARDEYRAQFGLLAELVDEGVIAIAPDRTIYFANRSMAEMLGCGVGDLQGRPVSSLIAEGARGTTDPSDVHAKLEAGERVETTLKREDGELVRVLVKASSMSEGNGLRMGALATVTPIAGKERFEVLFNSSPMMMMVTRSSDGIILEANDAFQAATGFDREELLGNTLVRLGIITETDAARLDSLLSEKGRFKDVEVLFRTSSGKGGIARTSAHRSEFEGEDCTVHISCDITYDGRDAPAGLARERDVLRSMLESSPDSVVITDLRGTVIECNPAAVSMMGLGSRAELVGVNSFELLSADSEGKARRLVEKLNREGHVRGISFRMSRADGVEFDMEISASVVRDPLGTPLYYVGIMRDVTDRVRYQAALEDALESRRQLEAIVNKSPAVVFRWRNEPGWPVDFVSENVRVFGYDPSDLLSSGLGYASAVHRDDLDRVSSEISGYLASGTDEFEQQYRLVSPGGEVHWVSDRTLVLRGPEGKVEAMQGIVVDITERKDAEARLSRTERQMKMFMDHSPAVKFLKDSSGRYVYVNRALQDAVGITEDEWLGKTDFDVFPRAVAEDMSASDREVFESGQLRVVSEAVPQKDGVHEYLTYKFKVPGVAGDEDLLAGISIDVTETRRYEHALEAANRKLNLLSQMTRHDIMNHLSVIMGWLDVTKAQTSDHLVAKRMSDMLSSARTIQRLLEFTAEYQEIGVEEPAWIDLDDAVAKGSSGQSLEDVTLEVDVAGFEVYADPMLERVFRNLIDNSLRHGEGVSRIRIGHRTDGDDLVLTVEDDGEGVSSEDKERIFERGFGKNTGLGLYMVRQVLDLTGITIVETGREGEGARFEVRIPAGGHRPKTDKG